MDEERTRDGVNGALYDRFALTIFTYIGQHVSHQQDAEDLLEEVFLAAFKNEALAWLSTERQLSWLLRVAKNKVIDRYRHRALYTLVSIDQAWSLEDGALTPEQYIEQEENYAHLYRALAQLSPLQQELIRLRYTKNMRYCEISRILEKSEDAVRKLYTRTLHQLRGIYYHTERGEQQ
jgi:RNA polymerase sigma-70 factor (ECF subfamily)